MLNTDSPIKKTSDSDDVSLKDVLLRIYGWYRMVISKWRTILFVSVLGALLGVTYAYRKAPLYTAVTTFVLEDDHLSGGGLGSLAGLASIAGVDLNVAGGGIFQGDNLLELYKSRSMLKRTLLSRVEDNPKRLIVDLYIELGDFRSKWRDRVDLRDLTFNESDQNEQTSVLQKDGKVSRLKDSVLNTFIDDIRKNYLFVTKPDKKLNIISVEVKAVDETFAKAFNTAIVRNVNDFYKQTKIKKSLDNISILQHKADSVNGIMNKAIYSAARVADATPNLNQSRSTQRVAPVQRSQFSAETHKAVLSVLVQNLEMAKMSLLKETPLIQVIDEPVYPLKVERLGKIKGAVIGAFIFGFLAVLFISFKYFIGYVFSDEVVPKAA